MRSNVSFLKMSDGKFECNISIQIENIEYDCINNGISASFNVSNDKMCLRILKELERDFISMLKKYNTDPTSVPQVRFWHQPLENWNKVKNTTNAPFYLRFFFARNISTLFMLLTCLAILFG